MRSSTVGTPPLVHCQLANHEVGTLQDVAERGGPLPASRASRSTSTPWPRRVTCRSTSDALGADLVSVSAHKMGGPAGMGALIVRRGLRIEPLLVGGEQERGRRAGLEDVVGAVGFGAAAAVLAQPGRIGAESAAARSATGRLLGRPLSVDGVVPFGDVSDRVPHIVCLGVAGVEAEPVVLGLDQAGVAVHSGSSCSSESLEPSPVLQAMGVDGERSLRLSVGWSTTDADVDAFVGAFGDVVARLRDLGA